MKAQWAMDLKPGNYISYATFPMKWTLLRWNALSQDVLNATTVSDLEKSISQFAEERSTRAHLTWWWRCCLRVRGPWTKGTARISHRLRHAISPCPLWTAWTKAVSSIGEMLVWLHLQPGCSTAILTYKFNAFFWTGLTKCVARLQTSQLAKEKQISLCQQHLLLFEKEIFTVKRQVLAPALRAKQVWC